ncbi:MAG: carbohydrate kinase family protein [Myxococcaceae bacterium]|nr:carbohydrate kinase family protein [Myxococcaceae bacterium]
MRTVVTGSLAYDYLMTFPGKFQDHILPDQLHRLTVSFLVDGMKRMRGGVAGNIAYTLALLGDRPLVVSAAGQDFSAYAEWMKSVGIDPSGIKIVGTDFTASCFINTDQTNNQIVAFYPGAASAARDVDMGSFRLPKDAWVVVSPTDPGAMAKHVADCKQLGLKYIFDPGKQTPRLDKHQILDGLQGAAVMVGNEYEFSLMAKATGKSEAELIAMAPITFVTRSERGSTIYQREGEKQLAIPAAKISGLADPTGAGDAFLGGVMYGLSRGLPLDVTGRIAALTAAYCIEHKGCQEHNYTTDALRRRYVENFGDAPALTALR